MPAFEQTPEGVEAEELRRAAISVPTLEELNPWYQRIEFPDGTTVGGWPTPEKARILAADLTLDGIEVLEVGAMSGGITKVWEQEFGARMTCVESDPRAIAQFKLVRDACDLLATLRPVNIEEPGLDLGRYPIVLHAGVYYHSIHPVANLEAAWRYCTDLMIVEGWIEPQTSPIGQKCVAAFIDNGAGWAQSRGTGYNYWRPTISCLIGWLRSLPGAGRIDVVNLPFMGQNDRAHLHVRRAPG